MTTTQATTEDDVWIRNVVIRRGFYVNMLCCLWNLLGDLVYSDLGATGQEIVSTQLPNLINRNKNSHNMLLLAQTAGWMYPVWGVFTGWQLYIGLKPIGSFYQSALPCILLAYSFCVIGGAQHSGWAFLTVLWQSPHAQGCFEQEGSLCRKFFDDVQGRIWRHMIVGDLPAVLLFVCSLWIFGIITLNRGKTLFPPWFNISNPLVTQTWVFGIVYFLPPPYAGLMGGPFGTWMVMTTNLACAWCLWNYGDDDGKQTKKKTE